MMSESSDLERPLLSSQSGDDVEETRLWSRKLARYLSKVSFLSTGKVFCNSLEYWAHNFYHVPSVQNEL